jgi:polysaccharide pyruvyl transferase WcaK-like protein
MRIVLIGNFGAGNLGDELLKEALLKELSGFDVTVCSAEPNEEEVPRIPTGMRSLVKTSWWETLKALRNADSVVFGGGTLFTDAESTRACFLWWMHVIAASAFGKPTLLSYQGIGPLRSNIARLLTASALRHCSFLSLREKRGMELVNVLNKKSIQSFDPVFSLLQGEGTCRTQEVFTLIPRYSEHWTGDRILTFRRSLRKLREEGRFSHVEILSFTPSDRREWQLCRALAGEIAQAVPVSTKEELLLRLAHSVFILSERYHGTIAALALGIPCAALGMSAGDKLMTLAEEAQCPSVLLSEWDGSPRSLMHMRSLSNKKRGELLKRCEQGKRALLDALNSLAARRRETLPA